jgi:EAL domain-containing protein (putative c-di-GMP-specific phosphodiesterase class I)/GGDEF domain-containing protein
MSISRRALAGWRYPDHVVTPPAPGVSGLGSEPSALSAFLTALADKLAAALACFVPIGSASPATRSHSAQASEADAAALEVTAGRWLNGSAGQARQLPLADDRIAHLAAVRSPAGELRGALVIARKAADRDPDHIAADLDLAAALLAPLLDAPPTIAARQSVLDWAATQTGGRAAFAVSIDRLNVANEVLGFRAGDTLLRTLDARMVAWAGPAGRLARIGGARYIVVRADLDDAADAVREADRLRALIAEPVPIDGLAVSRSASVGVAVDPLGTTMPDTLLANALRSGAAARSAGGDRTQLDDDGATRNLLERLRLELELFGALADGQLRMHYQPEFDLTDGRVVAVEALLRWQHPRLGLLRAESFVPDAEQTRTFTAVQHWVIDETCRQLADWRAGGHADQLVLRVNVPGTLVVRGAITDMLVAAFQRHAVPPDRVCIELTERRMPAELPPFADELAAWRDLGVTVALDDFGIGEGTLTHLITLPVDTIKIDQSFVSRMTTDARAATVVAGVIALARSLDLGVVAEGVDGADAVTELVRLGCTRGQGNALALAVVPSEITSLLAAQPTPEH